MQFNVKLTFTEELLGTKAADPAVFGTWQASKHPSGVPQADEVEAAERTASENLTGISIFHRDAEGHVGIYDYQIKGFFKDAIAALNRFDKEHRDGMDKLPAFKSKIDGTVFIKPRFILIMLPPGGAVGVCERPLRAETAQGPRVALARSETVPAGSTIEFTVNILAKEMQRWIQLCLNYGALRGLGQWRNSGKGGFTWAEA